ncbi:MAG: hypothetical protein IJW26_03775 [Clostridia bacterium]|nr:hypothetical protein [Clostridia bacterium]
MQAYLLTVILTSVAVSLAEMIMPNGKLKIVVNTVFSIAILLSVVSSLQNIESEDFKVVFNDISSDINYEELNYVSEYFDESASKYYQSYYKDKLKSEDLIAERVEVEICNLQIIKVSVFLSNLVIPEENEHININVIKSYVADVLSLSKERIEIYV